jgi:uncharacterized membrane protein YdjX (TVP38/TMEM64 family)
MGDPVPSLRPFLLRMLVAGVVVVVVPLAAVAAVPEVRDPLALREFFLGFGPAAPAVFVAVQAVQVLVAPVPGTLLAVVGGYLFGAVPGAAYSIAGTTIGSAVAFVLAHRYGRPYVGRLVGARRLAWFDRFVDRAGLPGVFLLFVMPGPWPDDVVCFVAGVSKLPLRLLVVVAAVGRGPSLALSSFVGANLLQGQALLAVVLAVALVVVWVLGYYYRRQLFDYLGRWLGTEPT